jgi:hypothetical protein
MAFGATIFAATLGTMMAVDSPLLLVASLH